MAWSTARKNAARDNAERLGRFQAPIDAAVVGVAGIVRDGARQVVEAAQELYGKMWVKVLLTVAFVGLVFGAYGAIDRVNF